MNDITNKKTIADYIFWLSVLLYLDPGGYFINLSNVRFSKMFFWAIIWIVFLWVTNFNGIKISFYNKSFRRALLFVMTFMLYYLFVFLIINDSYTFLSLTERLTKTRLILIGWSLIIPIYYFAAYRSLKLFLLLYLNLY